MHRHAEMAAPARKALVVGGAGFVGRALVRGLVDAGVPDILVIDNLLSSDRSEALELPGVRFVEASITEAPALEAIDDDTELVFHLATYHGNRNSIADPLADAENNLLSSLRLFDRLTSTRGLRRLVYASAGCTVARKTYDDPQATTEDAVVSLHMDSPYQVSKVAGEMYANFYFANHGLPITIARFQNVYGPGEVLGAGQWRGTDETVWRNVVPTFIYRAMKGMPLMLDNEGLSTRDFIYVGDIARGLILCATRGRPGGVYNLASGVETSIRELADRVVAETESISPVELRPKRMWDRSGRRFGSTVKARQELGFEASVTLPDGLSSTIDWFKANLASIDACVARHADRLARG